MVHSYELEVKLSQHCSNPHVALVLPVYLYIHQMDIGSSATLVIQTNKSPLFVLLLLFFFFFILCTAKTILLRESPLQAVECFFEDQDCRSAAQKCFCTHRESLLMGSSRGCEWCNGWFHKVFHLWNLIPGWTIGSLAVPTWRGATMIFRVGRKIGTRIGTAVGPGILTQVCKLGIGTWFRVCGGDALNLHLHYVDVVNWYNTTTITLHFSVAVLEFSIFCLS
jgi:hypothetical protein